VARRGPWRALAFAGAGALLVGLAFLVARPAADVPATKPYAGARGASREKAAGLEIMYRRGGEVQVLRPGTPLRPGDVLRLVVRAERPRYLVVQLRDGGDATTTIFPTGAEAVLVRPGDTLPVAPALGPAAQNAVVSALFGDHPFPSAPGSDIGPDVEVASVVIEKGAQ
jgi:hypothetical protein